MTDSTINQNLPVSNPQPTIAQPVAPATPAPVKPLSTFAKVALCKESTKDSFNNIPTSNNTPEARQVFDKIAQQQADCRILINKLTEENNNTQNPKQLLKALEFSNSRIEIEQKMLTALRKDTFEAKEIDNIGSLKYGLTLVRQQESIAWDDYKSYLENEKNGTTSNIIGNIGVFILILLLFGVIMAIGKRMNITK